MDLGISRVGVTPGDVNALIAAGIASARPSFEYGFNAQWLTLTNLIPADDSTPQISEGSLIISKTINLESTLSLVDFEVSIQGSPSTTSFITWAIFRNSVSDAIKSNMRRVNADHGVYTLTDVDEPGLAGDVTYSVRIGPSSGSFYLNGNAAGRILGASTRAVLKLKEIIR